MENENRLQLMVGLCSPLMFCFAILFNYLGSSQFRDYIFVMELFGAIAGTCIAALVMVKYLRVWYLDELRVTIIWKSLCSFYIICSDLYFIQLLLDWIYNKSYDCLSVETDQQWATWQLSLLILYIGGNLGALLDFGNILSVRVAGAQVKKFGETALYLEKISAADYEKLEKELNSMQTTIDGDADE